MGNRKCIVPSCKFLRNNNSKSRSMFKRPKDQVIAQLWANSIPGLTELRNNDHVCELHFDPSLITLHRDSSNLMRKRLQKTAVPTIFSENYGIDYNEAHSYPKYDMEYQETSVPQFDGSASSNFYENPSDTFQKDTFEISQIQLMDTMTKLPRIENTMTDVVKDLIASQELLMNIKKEELAPEAVTVKVEDTEEYMERYNAGRQSEMKSFTVYQYAKYNKSYLISLLPESWNIFRFTTDSDGEVVAFSKECTINENTRLLVMQEKNIVINRSGKVNYSIHGKRLKDINPEYLPKFPENIPNTEVMLKVIGQFDQVKICQGIVISDSEVSKYWYLDKDDLGFKRHIKCFLVTDAQQCDNCFTYNRSMTNNMMNRQVLTDIQPPNYNKKQVKLDKPTR